MIKDFYLRKDITGAAEFLVERFKGLHDARNTKLEVPFGAVEGADDQVDGAQVKELAVGVFIRHVFLLTLNHAHDLLCLET